MKKYLFIASVLFLISTVFFSCVNNEECKQSFSDNIVGRWKLIEVAIRVNSSPIDTTDYSQENIIFDFQKKNKLIVEGYIPNIIAVFDDFQAGEHFYEFIPYNEQNCVSTKPGANLSIDKPKLGNEKGHYFCKISFDEETMKIDISHYVIEGVIDDNSLVTGFNVYGWEKNFIKIK